VLVGDHGVAGENGAGAVEFAAVGQQCHEEQDGDVDGELDPVGGGYGHGCVGQGFPEDEEDGLGDGDGPDGAVEKAALMAFSPGGITDAGQPAARAAEEYDGAEGEVDEAVDLLHVPDAGDGGEDEAGEVEQGEVEGGVPGEGVADAAVEGIGAVLVEAKDVGSGLSAGQLAAQAGDAGSDEDDGHPGPVGPVKAAGEEGECEGAGGEEEDPDPDGPVTEAVDGGVAFAELALPGIFHFSAILHCQKFNRAGTQGLQTEGHRDIGTRDYC